jgi:hypothetical protein
MGKCVNVCKRKVEDSTCWQIQLTDSESVIYLSLMASTVVVAVMV